jgi:hypothetical protein
LVSLPFSSAKRVSNNPARCFFLDHDDTPASHALRRTLLPLSSYDDGIIFLACSLGLAVNLVGIPALLRVSSRRPPSPPIACEARQAAMAILIEPQDPSKADRPAQTSSAASERDPLLPAPPPYILPSTSSNRRDDPERGGQDPDGRLLSKRERTGWRAWKTWAGRTLTGLLVLGVVLWVILSMQKRSSRDGDWVRTAYLAVIPRTVANLHHYSSSHHALSTRCILLLLTPPSHPDPNPFLPVLTRHTNRILTPFLSIRLSSPFTSLLPTSIPASSFMHTEKTP